MSVFRAVCLSKKRIGYIIICGRRFALIRPQFFIAFGLLSMKCNLCPRGCNADRTIGGGVCKVRHLTVSRIAPHMWEEPCISGDKGSGTVFFAGCNLHCRFCQNYDISVVPHGVELSPQRLADVFLYLQDIGMANVNLVTPSHFSDELAVALELAKPRLKIPVVYNTSSYEKVSALKRLGGLVDVYLPDLKFFSSAVSANLAAAPDYFEIASAAIEEMKRQQPVDRFDANGYLTNGLVIRHLILPGLVEDTKRILDWIAKFDADSYVSLMSQYFVARTDDKYPQLNRRLFPREYDAAKQYFFNVGLSNGYFQELSSATEAYLPDFDDDALLKTLDAVPRVFGV